MRWSCAVRLLVVVRSRDVFVEKPYRQGLYSDGFPELQVAPSPLGQALSAGSRRPRPFRGRLAVVRVVTTQE